MADIVLRSPPAIQGVCGFVTIQEKPQTAEDMVCAK
jgi:hypothetical protein